MVEALNGALGEFKTLAVDATATATSQSIAGLHPRNLTNRSQIGRGIQLEFSEGARLVFFPGKAKAERQKPKGNLVILAEAIDGVLDEVVYHDAFRSR